MSPSSRRAWIEIAPLPQNICVVVVALLAEGVDRNFLAPCPLPMMDSVALLAEGVDRNTKGTVEFRLFNGRPPRGGRG